MALQSKGDEGVPDRQRALDALLAHAAHHSPYYREQDWAAEIRRGRQVTLDALPLTPKHLIRADPERFFSSFVPPDHGAVRDKRTSGSTGEPLRIRKTQRHFKINQEENRRLLGDWGVEAHRAALLIELPVDEHPAGDIEKLGKGAGRQWQRFYSVDSLAIYDTLRRTQATMMQGLPSLCQAALEHSAGAGPKLPVKLVWAAGEVVQDQLRELVGAHPGCRLLDSYGCVEAGLVAALCPHCGAYHIADRHVILEVIAEDGRPAAPGQMGRVVLTPLFNWATPLLRYEMEDYAIPAETGGCLRSALGLARIVGRERNLFKLPDGRKIMPRLPIHVAERLALRKLKLIQTTITDIEMLYVPRDEGMEISRLAAQDIVDRFMSPGFTVYPKRVQDIPRAPSGKYLMHECLV